MKRIVGLACLVVLVCGFTLHGQVSRTAKWAGNWTLNVQASTFGTNLIPGKTLIPKNILGQTLRIEQTADALKLSGDTVTSDGAAPQSVHEEQSFSLDGSETLIGPASFSVKPIDDLTFQIVSKLTTSGGTTVVEVSHFAVSSNGWTLIETKTQTENVAARIRISKSVLVFMASAIEPPVHTLSTNGTLRIRLNGAVTDWLLGANVAPTGATAKVQVFEIDRDFTDERSKMIGQGYAKSLSYPAVDVLAGTVQVNSVGLHDTTTVYVKAPAWTTIIVTGPNDDVLYQTYLTKTLLVSRGWEFKGSTSEDFTMVLPWSDRRHEARLRLPPRAVRYIVQTRQW